MAENFEKPRIPIQAWANDPYFKSIAPVYNPDDSYTKGQLAISPLGTLVKALEDTTGTYDPSKWQETKLSESLEEAMDRGIDILLGWKAGTQPDVSKIPQGVEVTYQGTVYTGTKVASALTKGQIILIGISDSEVPNIYKEYVTYKDGETYNWELIGTTEVNLDGYARQIAVVAESNRTVNGYQVPVLSNAQLITIYNGIVAGDSVVITDATGMMHFEGINADMISDEIFISFRYFDKMLLEYDEHGNIEFTPIGDGSNMTVAFVQASTRTNIATGEKLSVLFGKIAKWFADLKTVAFSGSYNDLSNKPAIPTNANDISYTYGMGYSPQTVGKGLETLTLDVQAVSISVDSKYTKPSSGIPKTDLASAVQTSLGKADSALQQHQSLAAYRTAAAQDTIDNDQNDAISGKQNKPMLVTSGTDITLADNTEYRLTNITSLTIAYPSGSFDCWLKITTASSGTISITLPSSRYIGDVPTFTNGETWELSIKDGVVVAGKAVSA